MTENKRFRKVMGFIQDNTCEGGDVEGVMDLTEIENMLNELNDECEFLKIENESLEDGATKDVELYHKSLKENKLLKQKIKELEFKLRTIEAYDRTEKEEHSDTVYVFEKNLEKW